MYIEGKGVNDSTKAEKRCVLKMIFVAQVNLNEMKIQYALQEV